MQGAESFSMIINALSSMSAAMRRELRKRIEEMDEAETIRLMVETFGAGARSCPGCGGMARHRHGSSCGLQRYRCPGCGRTCNALSGSPLARLKHQNLWLRYAFALEAQMSVREAATYCNVARNTALHWRHRFTDALASFQPDCLSGIVEIEETFFRENHKGSRKLDRPAFRRGTPAVRAAQKRRLIAVLIARDRTRATVIRQLAAPSEKEIHKVLEPIIPGDALLCTDGLGYYETFSRELGITHWRLVARRRERVKQGAFHIQNVNAFTSNLKSWMRKFRGVATKHLQKYLDWRCFIDAHSGEGLGEKLLRAILPSCHTAI